MNASDLYEVVKDVPREAWPSCVTGWIRGIYVEVRTSETGDKPHAVSSHMFTEDAILLFEASMMRRLATRLDWSVVVYKSQSTWFVVIGPDEWAGSSLIEALAAACKEQKR